jgi:hypothetical protein
MISENTLLFFLSIKESNPILFYSTTTQQAMRDSYLALGKDEFLKL